MLPSRRGSSTLSALAGVFVPVSLSVACSPASPAALATPPALATPQRPAGCKVIGPSEDLSAALSSASAGEALCLEAGTWVGQFRVGDGVTLWGSRASVLKTSGEGTTVTLGSQSQILGVSVDGSGGRFDVLDAAIKVGGVGAVVMGTEVRHSVFGILVEKASQVTVRGNHVVGIGGEALGMRGDGIRLWEAQHSRVEENWVEAARDTVVWYSSDNVIERNQVEHGRYGMHLMYSHRNRVADNRFLSNEVGIFAMYSRELTLERNLMKHAHGAAGMGIGAKESANLVVRDNLIADNTLGVFLDNSPLEAKDTNLFEHNSIVFCDVGVGFLASQAGNRFRQNAFRDNNAMVRVDGGGDALGTEWVENYWSDYAGYDLDRDGFGDVPYELRDLGDAMEAKVPLLGFLRGTPALALVTVAGEAVPLLAPKTVLRDQRPMLQPEPPGAQHAH